MIVFGLAVLATSAPQAAELQTLFTTPAERQLINSNRYNRDAAPEVIEVEETDNTPLLQQLITKEFTREYLVSGVTVSREGDYTVWINSKAYQDGGLMEDNSQVEVITGEEIRVRITTPDGNQHYAASGELLEVTFLAAVDEHDVDSDDFSAYADPLNRKSLKADPFGSN